MSRQYKVLNQTIRKGEDKVKIYIITDITDDELALENKRVNGQSLTAFGSQNDYYRPRVATFPVSHLYDDATQAQRAKMLADYLNKIQEVTEKAIRNTTLIDIMSINNTP